jgi:hypothetical protein
MHPTGDTATPDPPATPTTPGGDTGGTADKPYVVVWNDAVDLRQLGASIVLCTGVGLPAFLAARALLTRTLGTPALAGGYALLVGLVACIAAATICARLFRPKRTFGAADGSTADTGGSGAEGADHAAARAELERMGGTAEAFTQLPPRVQAEMTELGLAPLPAVRRRPDEPASPARDGSPVRTEVAP